MAIVAMPFPLPCGQLIKNPWVIDRLAVDAEDDGV